MKDFDPCSDGETNKVQKAKIETLDELRKMISSLADKVDGFVPWLLALFGTISASLGAIEQSFSGSPNLAIYANFALGSTFIAAITVFGIYGKKIKNSIDQIEFARDEIVKLHSEEKIYDYYINFIGSYQHPFRDMPFQRPRVNL
jgi:hypothetical protein